MWNRFKWIPLAAIATLFPLSAGLEILEVSFMEYAWFPNVIQWTDVFLVRRKVFLYGMAAVMLAWIVWNYRGYRNYLKDKCLWPLYGYATWNILAAIFSDYPMYAVHGMIESQETVFVLLAYVILAVYTYCVIRESPGENGCRILIGALVLGDFLVSSIGAAQFIGYDFWMTDIGKRMIVPEQLAAYRDTLQMNYDAGQVYGGFYNPKYAAIFFLMMLPVLASVLVRYAASEESDGIWKGIRILAGITLVFSVINIAASDSVTVYMCFLIFLLPCLCFFCVKNLKRRKIMLAAYTALLLLSGGIYLTVSGEGSEQERLERVRFLGTFLEIRADGEVYWLREAETEEGLLYPLVLDEDKNMPVLQWREDGLWGLPEGMTQNLAFQVYTKENIVYTMLYYKDIPMRFMLKEDQCKYISIYGKIGELKTAETLLPGKEHLLSGRGYIWGRTMAVLKEHLLFGTGPESFLLAFPQEDYVARANLGWGFFSEIIGNAHSLYLQIAVQSGVPGLLLFLIALFMYLKGAWRSGWSVDGKPVAETNRQEAGMRRCIRLSVLAYGICGMTWASNLSIAPFFWILLGTGMAFDAKENFLQIPYLRE